ncbi:hypothetical protein BIV04_03255 [Frigoribacterium sp. MCBA15_019]|nr:hypothetical protein BIV04_03255 [Frigoribacterium sp. MCBA15_019]
MPAAELGQISRSDVSFIFMSVREEARGMPLLRDVGDCIAHRQRTKGTSYQYVTEFVAHFRQTATHGGTFKIDLFFPIESILAQLHDVLRKAGVEYDSVRVDRHSEQWARLLASVLAGTRFDLDMAHCELVHEPQPHLVIQFLEDINGVLRIPTSVAIGVPAFVDSPRL